MNKVYIYSWWSGLCIEQQICKIYKETKDKVFFYNEYNRENDWQYKKGLRKIEKGYLETEIQ